MSYTADMFGPRVVIRGSATVKDKAYKGDGSQTFKASDLCRITTSGQIKLAATTTATTGPCHGMVLTNDYATTAATTSQFVPILEFGPDTEIEMQVYNVTPGDAQPQDIAVGSSYALRTTAGAMSANTSTSSGYLICTRKPGDNDKDFDAYSPNPIDTNYGVAWFKISAANLDGRGA